MAMGQRPPSIAADAARQGLTPGQTEAANARRSASSRAELDEQELRDLEAVELYGAVPAQAGKHKPGLIARLLRRG
jgi:hypothetical protein